MPLLFEVSVNHPHSSEYNKYETRWPESCGKKQFEKLKLVYVGIKEIPSKLNGDHKQCAIKKF